MINEYEGEISAERFWASLMAHLQCGRPGFDPWVGKTPLEEGKTTHSSILAWRIPWAFSPLGSQRVGHD